jgi:hypothetical protein
MHREIGICHWSDVGVNSEVGLGADRKRMKTDALDTHPPM